MKKSFDFLCLVAAVSLLRLSGTSLAESARWWPVQKAPKAIVRTQNHEKLERVTSPNGKFTEGGFSATHILLQSISGLAAKGVNEGRCDEMVWIEVGHPTLPLNPDYKLWIDETLERTGIEDRGTFTTEELVRRFKDKGIIKGYILYSYDYNEGIPYERRDTFDRSANVASSLAGIMDAIVVEEGQEEMVKSLGIERVFDARGKDMAWCFENYKDQLSRDCLATVDPKVAHCRAFAIANKAAVVYGIDEPVPTFLAWLNPLSTVAGWNIGDENKHTSLLSRYGQVHTAANWSLNIPFLSATSKPSKTRPDRMFDPSTIDWNMKNAVCFTLSDGDNVGWFMGDFCLNKHYWSNPYHGDFAFGWTTCLASLSEASGITADYLFRTQRPNTTLIEFAGGYHFPDEFGKDRPEKDLVERHARRVSEKMNAQGLRVFGFICRDLDSPAAMKAYEIYAREIENLAGMIAIQYHPYEGGNGDVYWFKNKQGIEIPVVTAKYSIWSHANRRESGTPAQIAKTVNEDARAAAAKDSQLNAWGIVHAWSSFHKIEGNDVRAENANYMEPGTGTALTAVKWCIDRLEPGIQVVCPEELIWRIRMLHNPEQTKAAIKSMKQ